MSMCNDVKLSIVVPLGPNEQAWFTLFSGDSFLPQDSEIIFSAVDEPSKRDDEVLSKLRDKWPCTWLTGPAGRGRQLNLGARAAKGRLLWFVHADTVLTEESFAGLSRILKESVTAVWFFDLRFLADGPGLMELNQFGAWFRSRCLGLPFGDQALCMKREVFEKIGGFCEGQVRGEDHHFVWSAKRCGYPVRPVHAPVWTSARRYQTEGWLRTTLTHLWMTASQAFSHRWG